MRPRMSIPINSLEPLTPGGVGDADDEEEHGGADVDDVGAAQGEDESRGQDADDTLDDGSFFHKNDQAKAAPAA